MRGRLFDLDDRLGRNLAAFCAGALAAIGQAPVNWGLPTFLGIMVGFFLFRRAANGKQVFSGGLVFGFGYFAVALNWLVEPFFVDAATTGWMAPFALAAMSGGLALFWALAWRAAFALKGGPLVWAALMALAELARAYLFTGFPWAMPAYAWINASVVQLASLIGPHGLNFVLFLAAALLVQVFQTRWGYRVGLAVVVALSVFPMPKPSDAPSDGPLVRLIQPNAPQHEKWDPDKVEGFFDRQIALTSEAGNPDFVIWPETSVPFAIPYAEPYFEKMAEAAGEATVITGVQRLDGIRVHNAMAVLDHDGQVAQTYDKHHLVPFGEYLPFGEIAARFGLRGLAAEDGVGFAAGSGPKVLDIAGLGNVLPLICYEVVFPQDLRVDQRPDVLLQITNDAWFGSFSGPYQHLAQARMRAIEQGLPMIRVANTGVTAVIDAKGRVLDQLPLGQHGKLDTYLPASLDAPLYARTGDLVLTLMLLSLLAIASLRAIRNFN